jgi:exodeoxyribonuclease-3
VPAVRRNAADSSLRIASFNINGVVRRLANLIDWLDETRPDIVCLQELKVPQASFPEGALAAAGYRAVWAAEGRWNGVAILARGAEPVPTRTALPDGAADRQRRYIEAAVRGILVASIYAPNGNPQPGPKFDYKLAWLRRLRHHSAGLRAAGVPVVLAGDFNVVPEARDIYPTTSYDDDALVQPQARAAYARLLADGWTDALRALHPEGELFTFWDYRRNRWQRNAGLRLDHLLLGPDLAARLAAAGIDRQTRGRDGASDHAPVWIEIG